MHISSKIRDVLKMSFLYVVWKFQNVKLGQPLKFLYLKTLYILLLLL